ncbi:lytic transglycosylase domain-containing protein [Amnibacterium flavum]|nr:lytic transglycosylase domain-containing protein [Amnibacterium flavum]
MQRSRFRGNLALSLFGFLAAFAFILVNVTDPYAGAVASPYYHASGAEIEPQILASADAYEVSAITRDDFTVTEKPKVVEVAPAASASWAPPAAAVPDPGSAQAIAAEKVAARGWGTGEFDCLVALWNKESGWRVNAYNASSGAYGIPQALPGNKMASAGADWETSASTQIDWGLGYITGRYGTPCGAWQSSVDRGWY